MSKAMLIMDMPESCVECRFSDCKMGGRCLVTNEKTEIITKVQDWCPLLEVPKKDSKFCYPSDYEKGYGDGYNACIDEILNKH